MEDPNKPLVIYVPGLYGSKLVPLEGGRKRKWNPPVSGIVSALHGKPGHKDLALPVSWDTNEDGDYVQDEDDIYAYDCVKGVQGKMLTFLEGLDQNGLIELHKVVWDWRRTFEETEKLVAEEIASICKEDDRKATLITHGCGAMITWPTISSNPEWFSTWVNAAGWTLYGSTKHLKELNLGLTHELLQVIAKKPILKALSEEAIYSFAGLYSFLPVRGEAVLEGQSETGLVKSDGTFCSFSDIDLHNVFTWEQYSLGIFAWKKEEVTLEEKAHIQYCLDAAKRFRTKHFVRSGNRDPSDPSYLDKDASAYEHLKIVCYGNDQIATHNAFEVNKDEKVISVAKSKVTSAGDKSLPTGSWQTIPGGLEREIIESEKRSTHMSMINDKKLRYVVMDALFVEDSGSRTQCQQILKEMEDETDQAKLVAAIFLIFSFILGYGGLKLMIDVLGLLYPAYMTLQYDPVVAPQDAVQWMTYWLVYSSLNMIEGLFPIVFMHIPYYFSAKMGIMIWLCHPDTMGAKVIFNQLLRPMIDKESNKNA
ncbi:unnamed protein product [Cylindrotheca closterium]|uniref:Receptor expression-enhancing protein n=1 Tax=Cylindrotheca closterium TaxID=2856 RepID=A0AAD2CRD8_9STRA|nr:unnamed protein product [Cylindrotheca closterium]